MGRVHVVDSDVSYNKGNGIKHKSLDGHFPVLDSEDSFCRRNIIGGVQTFPQLILGIPDTETSGPCELVRYVISEISTFSQTYFAPTFSYLVSSQ